jgi:hypothetical protein
LLITLTISLIILLGSLIYVNELDANLIISRLLWLLARLMIFITVGLIIGQVIEAAGWIKGMSLVALPLFRFGRLGDHCSSAFTAAFFSGVTANAMLLDFFKDGHITRRQLFLTNFINQLPAFFLHLPTTFFIVVPLTGRAGVIYFLITFLAVVMRTFFFILFGNILAFPVRALRHQLPRYIGIFSPKMGTQLLLLADLVIYADSLVPEELLQWTRPGTNALSSAPMNLEQIVAWFGAGGQYSADTA